MISYSLIIHMIDSSLRVGAKGRARSSIDSSHRAEIPCERRSEVMCAIATTGPKLRLTQTAHRSLLIWRDSRTRDEHLDRRPSVLALASLRRRKGLGDVLESVPVRDQRLQINLACSDERYRERIVARLCNYHREVYEERRSNIPRNGTSRGW